MTTNSPANQTNPAAKPTPVAETYAARRGDIARLLDVLDMHLDINDQAAKADPGNWGLAGNLGKVRADLVNLVGFLASMDPAAVEEFLKDGADAE